MEKCNLLNFLLVSTDHGYKFKPETDDAILDEINKSSDTLIVIDGLDEAEITGDFSKHPHGMSLYEKEKAYHILMNLLNCRLLPNAKKLIASRPNAFLKFNPECKPVFMLQVLGLSKESQNLLCKQYSKTEEQQKHVQDELEKQPNVSALLFIPIFARLIIPYFVDHLESNKPVLSISDVFLNQLKQWQKNPKFHTDLKHLKQLTKLALDGIEHRQFSFPCRDFVKHGIEMKSIEPFMCAHAKHQHGMLVLDGEKTFFFIHATWQEFLAALHLMVFASYEEFSSKIQQIFQQSSWEVVVRFLFGFCHQKVQEKLNTLFPDTQEINRKEKLVKAQARMLLPKLSELPSDIPSTAAKAYDDIIESFTQISEFESREKDSTLSNICSWANEAKDDDLTKAVANSLPNPLLLSGDFLPHQVMSFCHVLSAAEESHKLNVGDLWNQSTFTGPGLHTLLSTIQQSKHQIPKLHLEGVDLSVDFEIILELLPGITELSLDTCGLTISMVENLVGVITQHNTHLSYLDLSFNNLNGVGKYLAKSIHLMQVVELVQCNLQEDDFNAIAEATARRDTNMSLLNLGDNVMSKKALDSFAPGVHKLDGMGLNECSVTGDGLDNCALKSASGKNQ
uniref:Protein NLRC3-like n=1 Tax=Phallusia mammillata TaxID=59560 RepID=A0A6F9DN01_9ASCI|nr:protein NLRC3-like [Phallusia mammillata]